jgi:hexosaminidase
MKKILLIAIAAISLIACKNEKPIENPVKDIAELGLIPQPQKAELQKGGFVFSNKTRIVSFSEQDTVGATDLRILNYVKNNFYDLSFAPQDSTLSNILIFNKIKETENLKNEAYILNITPKHIEIQASSSAGFFYGLQTLGQILPDTLTGSDTIPAIKIEDYPQFKWRGAHLDVCRHFFDKEFVKKYIDLLAKHKMNTFHWHLTEDQGWRIEIKKYPKLTEIGSVRKETIVDKNFDPFVGDGKEYGGFYTQEDIKEIVAYANDRFITIIPEIEMPGHSLAALAAYPNFSCTGGPFEVMTRWGVSHDIYCAGNDSVFLFLQDVLDEVLALFPSKYIHIGGDEAPKTRWEKCPKCQARIKAEGLKDEHELQSYFITRIEKYLNSKGRQIIGWDEILEGGLAPNAAVMSWRGEEGGIEAANQNHYVVMTPGKPCYFDHYQSEDKDKEPLAIGGYNSLQAVYEYSPITAELPKEKQKYILGSQANVWTEYIQTSQQVEYMTYPRLCALSEVVWTGNNKPDYNNFIKRLQNKHLLRLQTWGVNYRELD